MIERQRWWAVDPEHPDRPWDYRFYTRRQKAIYWLIYVVFLIGGTALLIALVQLVTPALVRLLR